MSRLPDFQKTIYLGMNDKGEVILLPNESAPFCWAFCERNGIKKISPSYKIQADDCIKITIKAPKSAPTPTVAPKRGVRRRKARPEALNKASEVGSSENKKPKKEEAGFYCENCKKDVDNPKAPNGEVQCPHCLRVNTIVGKE